MSARENFLNFLRQLFDQFLMKFGYKNSKVVYVNQLFKPPFFLVYYYDYEVMTIFHITLGPHKILQYLSLYVSITINNTYILSKKIKNDNKNRKET